MNVSSFPDLRLQDMQSATVTLMDMIYRSQAGDTEAFRRLFEQYKNLVYKTALLMLGNPADADDALQEVFLRMHRSLGSYRPDKGAFSTWLYRITVNYCLNQNRRRQPESVSIEDIEPPGDSDHRRMERRLVEDEILQQALRSLSDKLRIVLVLRYYWELPSAEVAQILEIPVGTVKSRTDLALKTLQKQFELIDPETRLDQEVEK
jgi:RNA polymerase sigma-70 factor (ECF subfamily)